MALRSAWPARGTCAGARPVLRASREQVGGPSSAVSILNYTILYYTILYYTILYYTILYYTILYYTILYYTILYYTILYYTILYYTILYYTILYYTLTLHHVLVVDRKSPPCGLQYMSILRRPVALPNSVG